MTTLIGIAALVMAIGWSVSAVLAGASTLVWARRCDPRNRSFLAPMPAPPASAIAALLRALGRETGGTGHG